MSSTNEVARNLLEQEPGRNICHANAANTPKIAYANRQRHNSDAPYRTTSGRGEPYCTRLQTGFLMRIHGLTEAQANALAVLIWGGL